MYKGGVSHLAFLVLLCARTTFGKRKKEGRDVCVTLPNIITCPEGRERKWPKRN